MTENFKISPAILEPNFVPLGLVVDPAVQTFQPAPNAASATAPVSTIVPGPNGPVLPLGAFQSPNYSAGNSGWKIDSNGDVEFGSGKFRGDITGASGTFSGTVTASAGSIGGFSIGTDYVKDAADSFGLASTVTGGDDVRFWSGATFANRATAPFRVTEAGAVVTSNITITGGSITGPSIVSVVALNLANRGWTQTCVFSVTDADTIAWGSGTFVTADGGTSLSISSGNTGNMAAKTYIYLDANVSLTAYQTTTTASTAVGASKVLIAIAQNGTGEATFQVLQGQGGQNIDAANIVANSITANELSTSITYAGAIIIDTAGLIRSGQTAYDSGTGWFIGNVSGTPKLSIGNSAGNKLTWDGTSLMIFGSINGSINDGVNQTKVNPALSTRVNVRTNNNITAMTANALYTIDVRYNNATSVTAAVWYLKVGGTDVYTRVAGAEDGIITCEIFTLNSTSSQILRITDITDAGTVKFQGISTASIALGSAFSILLDVNTGGAATGTYNSQFLRASLERQ